VAWELLPLLSSSVQRGQRVEWVARAARVAAACPWLGRDLPLALSPGVCGGLVAQQAPEQAAEAGGGSDVWRSFFPVTLTIALTSNTCGMECFVPSISAGAELRPDCGNPRSRPWLMHGAGHGGESRHLPRPGCQGRRHQGVLSETCKGVPLLGGGGQQECPPKGALSGMHL